MQSSRSSTSIINANLGREQLIFGDISQGFTTRKHRMTQAKNSQPPITDSIEPNVSIVGKRAREYDLTDNSTAVQKSNANTTPLSIIPAPQIQEQHNISHHQQNEDYVNNDMVHSSVKVDNDETHRIERNDEDVEIVVSLDDLFKKTVSKPQLYWLQCDEDEINLRKSIESKDGMSYARKAAAAQRPVEIHREDDIRRISFVEQERYNERAGDRFSCAPLRDPRDHGINQIGGRSHASDGRGRDSLSSSTGRGERRESGMSIYGPPTSALFESSGRGVRRSFDDGRRGNWESGGRTFNANRSTDRNRSGGSGGRGGGLADMDKYRPR